MSIVLSRPVPAALAGLLSLAVLLGGCGQRMAAKINGEVVSQEQFYNRCANFTQGQLLAPPTGLMVMDQVINDMLVAQEAKRKNLEVTDAEVNAEIANFNKQMAGSGQTMDQRLKQVGMPMDVFKEGVRRILLQRKLFTQGVAVTDKEIQDYYNQNKQSQFTTNEQVKARQITVPTDAAAKEVKQTLDKNADFALVARSKSIDQFKDQGGELPPLTRGFPNPSVSPQVFSAAFTAPVGKATDPLKVGNNYIILQVEKKTPQSTKTLAETKDEIRQMLQQQKAVQSGQAMKIQQRMMELRRDADIQIGLDQFKGPIMQQQQSLKQQPAAGMTPVLPQGR